MTTMSARLQSAVESIQSAVTEELKSIYIGQIGAQSGSDSDTTITVILSQVNEAILQKMKPASKKLLKLGVQIKVFTDTEITRSIDVFPIEFFNLNQTGTCVAGEPILETLSIPETYIRQECEFYLRSTVVKVREAFISGTVPTTDIIKGSFGTYISVFRALVHLIKQNAETDADLIRTIETQFDLSLPQCLYLAQHPDDRRLDSRFDAYLSEIRSVLEQVDALGV